MTVVHTVLIQFKDDITAEDIKTLCHDFFLLKESCLHPTTKAPYILSVKGGKNNSSENLQVQSGITHGFVAEFASTEDRDYYTKVDPAHQVFAGTLIKSVAKVIVVDFTNGEY